MKESTKSLLKEAREAIKNKDYVTSMKLSKSILKEDKTNYMALVFLGLSLQEIGPTEQAPNAFKKAIQSNSSNPLAWNGLANYYEKIDSVEAKTELVKAYLILVTIESNEKKILEYAEKLTNLSEFGEVENILSKIHDLIKNEKYAEIKNNLWIIVANLCSKIKVFSENLYALYSEALTTIINNKDICNKLYYSEYLTLLNKQSKYEDLLNQAEKMQELYENDPVSLGWICKVYNQMYVEENSLFEKFDSKISNFSSKLLNLEPENAMALFTLSISLVKDNKYVEAKDILKNVTHLRPGLIHAWAFLSKICVKLNLFEEALHSLQKTDKLLQSINYSNLILKQTNLVLTLEILSKSGKLSNWEEAIAIYKKIEENDLKSKCLPYIIQANINLEKFVECKLLISKLNAGNIISKLLTAKVYSKQKKYEEALKILESENVEQAEWWIEIGLIYWGLNEHSKCLIPFLKAAKIDPNSYLTFLYLGHYYQNSNDYDKARRCYEKAFKINQSSSEAGIQLSKIYRKLKNWDANLNLLQSLTSGVLNENNSWAWLQLGLHYLEQEEYDKAVDNLRFVVRIDSENRNCWEALADAYFTRGAYTSALKSYQKASELSENDLYPSLQIANIEKILGEYSEAKKHFEEILFKNGLYVPALKGLAETSMNLARQCYRDNRLGTSRDHAQYAVEKLSVAIQQRSELSCLWKLLGDACIFVGKLPEKYGCLLVPKTLVEGKTLDGNAVLENEELFGFATRCFCKAISLIEDNILIWHDLASCYLSHFTHTSDDEKREQLYICAFEAAQHCTRENPIYWQHWNLLGNVAMAKDPPNYALAQHAYIKAVTVEHNNAVSWCNLGILYLILGDVKLANKAFSQGQRSDPNYVNSWIGQAIIAENMGHEEAMDLFRHSTQLGAQQQGAIGYGQWVCRTLLESPPNAVIYSIHSMHAIPVACDALTWYAEKEPYDSCAWNMLGILKERMGLKSGALEAFRKAYRLSSKVHRDQCRVNYGRLLFKAGKYAEAIDMFQEVESATFNSGSGLALALFEDKHYEESYSAYESALHWLTEEQSLQSDLLVALASMAYMFQGPNEAKTLLFQSINLKPPSPWGLYATLSLGLLHDDVKLAKLVINELESLKDQKECLYHYSNLLSYYYIMQGEYVKAVREVSKLIHRHPDDASVWLNLCSLLTRLNGKVKMPPGAARIAHLVMKMGQTKMDVTRVLCLSCVVSHLAGNEKDALLSAQKALHCYPNVPEAWAVLSLSITNGKKSISETFANGIFQHVKTITCSENLLKWFINHLT